MDQQQSSGADTGTDDKTYNLVSVLYHALQGAENCEIYAEDADDEQRQFFDRVRSQHKSIADETKQLLHDQLMYGEGIGQDGQQGASNGQAASAGTGGQASAGNGM